jgi:hypothetical protein
MVPQGLALPLTAGLRERALVEERWAAVALGQHAVVQLGRRAEWEKNDQDRRALSLALRSPRQREATQFLRRASAAKRWWPFRSYRHRGARGGAGQLFEDACIAAWRRTIFSTYDRAGFLRPTSARCPTWRRDSSRPYLRPVLRACHRRSIEWEASSPAACRCEGWNLRHCP